MKYRGVIHMHSTHSYDGKVSLAELKKSLISRGCSFACMTEHTDTLTHETAKTFVKECEAQSDSSFIFIPGFEVPYLNSHILMIGANDFIAPFASTPELLAQWKEKASFVVLAHPVRNRFVVDDAMCSVLQGIEIWNQQYDGKLVPRIASYKLLTKLRKVQLPLLATGGLDFHRKEHLGSPFTFVTAETLSTSAILGALTKGDFVFSSDSLEITARGPWNYTATDLYVGLFSVVVIEAGKFVNKNLKRFGLSLPKKLKEKIRSKI